MPLHVLQLGPVPPPEGGISRNILAIRDELIERGDKCSIIATSRSTTVIDEPDVYHPGSKAELLGLLRRLDFDALHLHVGGDVTNRVLALAFACTIFAKGRCVMTVHSGGYGASKEHRSPLAGLVFRRFSKLIAVNDDLAKVFRGFGVPDEKIDVVLPFSLKPPDDSVTIPTALAEFADKHSPLLLAVGGLEKEYDPLMQIDALKDILHEFPNAGLMIVGSGSMLKEAKASVAASGYADHIYLAGNVEHAITLHLMNKADIVLRTTLFDGDAISVREALFLGKPVIATDNGMRPEDVELIPIGDREALIEKVQEVAQRPARGAPTTAADNSNIKKVVDLYENLVEQVS